MITQQRKNEAFDLYQSLSPDAKRSAFARVFGYFESNDEVFEQIERIIQDMSKDY